MKIDSLYPLQKNDVGLIIRALTECFLDDPLYQKLIPQLKLRAKALPEVFECDASEMLESCNVYADSPAVNGLVIVDDETEPYNPLKYLSVETFYALKTDAFLVKEDLSLKTLWNFFLGRKYLNSKWTDALPDERMHLIYFAVRPSCRGSGIAHRLISPVLNYADQKGLIVSLETHNAANLPMYQHYHFELFKTLKSHFDLTQYCLVRKPRA